MVSTSCCSTLSCHVGRSLAPLLQRLWAPDIIHCVHTTNVMAEMFTRKESRIERVSDKREKVAELVWEEVKKQASGSTCTFTSYIVFLCPYTIYIFD